MSVNCAVIRSWWVDGCWLVFIAWAAVYVWDVTTAPDVQLIIPLLEKCS